MKEKQNPLDISDLLIETRWRGSNAINHSKQQQRQRPYEGKTKPT
jgi:hypothetical protein